MRLGVVRDPVFREHDTGPYHCEVGERLAAIDRGHRPMAGAGWTWTTCPCAGLRGGAEAGAPPQPPGAHRLHGGQGHGPGPGHHLLAPLPRDRPAGRGQPHRPVRRGPGRRGGARLRPGAPPGAPRHGHPGHGLLPVQQRGRRRGPPGRPAGPRPGAHRGLGRAPRQRHRGHLLRRAPGDSTSPPTSRPCTPAPARWGRWATARARGTTSTYPWHPAGATWSTCRPSSASCCPWPRASGPSSSWFRPGLTAITTTPWLP